MRNVKCCSCSTSGSTSSNKSKLNKFKSRIFTKFSIFISRLVRLVLDLFKFKSRNTKFRLAKFLNLDHLEHVQA